jgi:hypothetical protein
VCCPRRLEQKLDERGVCGIHSLASPVCVNRTAAVAGASASSAMSSASRSPASATGGVGGPPPTGAAAVLVAATLPPESAVAGAAARAHALASGGVPATAAAKQLLQPLPPTAAATSPLWPRTRHFIAGYASGAALVMVRMAHDRRDSCFRQVHARRVTPTSLHPRPLLTVTGLCVCSGRSSV